MMNLFVCQICGEPYMGRGAPDECPFCGAPKKYIGPIEDYEELWNTELNDQEKKNVKKTLDLELNAAAYYNKVAKTQDKYSKYERAYKQLARVEEEHLEIAAKFLGVEEPELEGEDPKGSIKKDLVRTKELEKDAMGMYRDFLEQAEHEKAKKFWKALIHAENGHANYVSAEI